MSQFRSAPVHHQENLIMRQTLFLVTAVLAACCGSIALAQHGNTITPEKQGVFAVPRMAKPPVVDGTIDPAEWKESLAIGGLASQNPGGNQLIMRPTTYFLAWDADNLYVACRTWLMPGYKPRVSGRAPGTANAFDDGMEFNIRPMGKNIPEGATDNSYKFFITCFGSDGDFGRVSVGQIFRNWRPRFKTAVRLTEPGSAPQGGRWWEAEIVMPAKDFELVGPNRAGDTWKMLLAFNHIPGFFQAAVPLGSSYFDSSGWPTMTLVEDTPAVQVTMDELPGLKDGVAAVRITAHNPTAKPVALDVQARVDNLADPKQPVALIEKQAKLEVAPGQTAEFRLNEKLPGDLGKNTGAVSFRVAQDGRELYRYYAFLTLGYPENWVKYTPPTEAFPVRVGFNPVRNNVSLVADTNDLDDPRAAKQVRYTVAREGEAAPLVSGTLSTVAYNAFDALLQLPQLQPGGYTVAATMDLADGKSLGPVTRSFKKRDEAKDFAGWWKQPIGSTERVIKPFTPLTVEKATVGVWGRSFALDAVGLPRAIMSSGKPVLAAPARIVAVIGGKEQSIDLSGTLEITEQKPWRAAFRGKAAGAGLTFTTTGSVEQDGLVTVNLAYAPAGKEPVAVDALRLEFPLSGSEAQALNCMGPGGNFATLSAEVLPPKKTGRLWSTLELGAGGTGLTVGTFYPDVWIGNEERGFYWWADSDEGWMPADDVAAHEVVREEGADAAVVLRNNIIGKPAEVTGARSLTFTYNATPFKPFPKGWRATINAEDGTFSGPHKQYKDAVSGRTFDGTQWLSAPAAPADWGRVWGEFKEKADAKVREFQSVDPLSARRTHWVHNSLALMGYGTRSGDDVVETYFRPEWDENTLCPSQQDYFLWLAKRAFAEGGLRSIYWDIFFIRAWSGEQNGMAYRLPDGRLQPTYNGLNLRKLSMRLASLQEEVGLAPGGVSVHSSNCFPFVAFPWVAAGLDGEWAFMSDASTRDWVDNYPPDRMRALNTPQNYGVPLTWMSINQITDPVRKGRVWRGFYDWARFHDCNWYGWDGYRPGDKLIDWGLADERLRYVPHWRNTAIISADPDVLVAYWQLPGRVFAMAFNHDGKEAKNAALKVDLAALGLTGGSPTIRELRGIDGRNGQLPTDRPDPAPGFDAATRTVAVPGLEPHSARYIGLRVENPADVKRLADEFQAVGNGVAVTDDMLDWGLAEKPARFFAAGQASAVKAADPAAKVAMWQLPDRVLLAVVNTTEKPMPVTLDIDLENLGLVPQLPWQEFVRVRDFGGGPSKLDFHGRKLDLGVVQPGKARLVGVRKY
jgi:hypothetical protein